MEVLLGIAAGMIIGNVIGHWQAWPEIRKLRKQLDEAASRRTKG